MQEGSQGIINDLGQSSPDVGCPTQEGLLCAAKDGMNKKEPTPTPPSDSLFNPLTSAAAWGSKTDPSALPKAAWRLQSRNAEKVSRQGGEALQEFAIRYRSRSSDQAGPQSKSAESGNR